jgi:hypothetical protein
MFILVFRPHQRPAWAAAYDTESDVVCALRNDLFARSCNADCDGDTLDALSAAESAEERYRIAIERIGHDLYGLTRLDDQDEAERYCSERDYCGHHNKGIRSVVGVCREIGWFDDGEQEDFDDE